MEKAARVVVTLVHGTWARDATWVKSGSKLVRHLEAHLPRPFAIVDFSWSGRNSPRARRKAALGLSQHLQQISSVHPEAIQFVIGHSHGGTVSLKAVAQGGMSDRIYVICLSTPFFHVRPRFAGQAEKVRKIGYGIAALLYTIPFFLQPTMLKAHTWEFLLFASSILALAFGIWRLWENAARDFAEQISIPPIPADGLMVVRMVGDEASAFIAAFQIATWLMARLGLAYVSMLIRIVDFSIRMRDVVDGHLKAKDKWVLGVAAFVVAVDVYLRIKYGHFVMWDWFMSVATSQRAWQISDKVTALGLRGPHYAVILALPAIALALGITLSGVLPLGFQALVGLLLYEVTVETVPPGIWTVYQIEPEGETQGLMHSLSYENQVSLTAITDWITNKAAAGKTNRSRKLINVRVILRRSRSQRKRDGYLG